MKMAVLNLCIHMERQSMLESQVTQFFRVVQLVSPQIGLLERFTLVQEEENCSY